MEFFILLGAFSLALTLGLGAAWSLLGKASQSGNSVSDGSEYQREYRNFSVFDNFRKQG